MISWSVLDEMRFGLKTAKLTIDSTDIDVFGEVENFKNGNGKLLIARCDSRLTGTLAQLQSLGFFLADSMLTFTIDPESIKHDYQNNPGTEVFLASKNDSECLAEIARKAFAGYRGHYHNNPSLDDNICDEAYIDWARNLVLGEKMADAVFLCRTGGKLVGFASLKVNEGGGAKAGLLGVLPEFRGKGVGKILHQARFQWCLNKDIREIHVETSLNNPIYINVLLRLGFEFFKGTQIMHLNCF